MTILTRPALPETVNLNGERMSQIGEERPVLVTGFGPFHHHTVNASWVAVQGLSKLGVRHNSSPVPLEIREIPVAYEDVSSTVPKLFEELQPRLCVHVGVSPYNVIKLEQVGRNNGYCMADIYGRAPGTMVCVPNGPEAIQTRFNVERICEQVSKQQVDVTFEVSRDAGRYLCDFIYYTSLHLNKSPVVFVHVPELNKPYSADQLAVALKKIVEVLLDEMNDSQI